MKKKSRNLIQKLIFKMTIFQKLLIGVIVLLILIILLAKIGMDTFNCLESNTKIILKVSNRHNKLNNLKISFSQLIMPANDYLIEGYETEIKNFKELDSIINSQIRDFKIFDAEFTKQYPFKNLEDNLNEIEIISKRIFELKKTKNKSSGYVMMELIDDISVKSINVIDGLLKTSNLRLQKYINASHKAKLDASRKIILLLLIIITSLIIGGFFYVKSITKPIDKLTVAAKKFTLDAADNKKHIVTSSSDEIKLFTNLFNNMIGVLSETTVSKDYFNDIIHRINETLIITDINRKILIVNKATTDLLEYSEEELIGKSIDKILLGDNKNKPILSKDETAQNIYNTYYSKSNLAIPVSFSKSYIFDNKNNKTGVLYLGFHREENSINKQQLTDKSLDKENNIKLINQIPLTKRELEIIKLIVKDYNNRQIADKLFISVRTVETHRKHIMEKLNAKSIIGLVQYAIQNNLI
jgi:PAS domain S-box-containing protein